MPQARPDDAESGASEQKGRVKKQGDQNGRDGII
jgi:hypothetical protein